MFFSWHYCTLQNIARIYNSCWWYAIYCRHRGQGENDGGDRKRGEGGDRRREMEEGDCTPQMGSSYFAMAELALFNWVPALAVPMPLFPVGMTLGLKFAITSL
jgi:hypothetical protein